MSRAGRRADCRIAAAATLLTLAMAWPVVVAPGERIFGNEIVGRHHDPFTVMRQFDGEEVPTPYLQPATDWPGRLLAMVVSPVAAYNIVVLATFPLAALFAYLLALDVTGSRIASVVAALAFAFSPFHVAHAAYHPHVAQVQWLALYLLALWRCVHGFSVARAALLAVAGVLVAASSHYSGLIVVVMTPIVAPLFWLAPTPAGVRRNRRALLATAAGLLLLALASALLLYRLVPDVVARPDLFRVPFEDLYRYSARWWAHFVPPVDHVVFGGWARSAWVRYGIGPGLLEQQVYLGLGLIALATAAGWHWMRGGLDGGLRAVPALAAIAGVAVVCGLSPSREIGGWLIVRPSAVIYEAAPMFRSYARFSVVVQLMVALLAGIGAGALWRSHARFARTVLAVLLAVAVLEYAPVPWPWRDVLPSSAHRWVAENGGETPRVFDCAGSAPAELATGWLAGYAIDHADASAIDCGTPSLGAQLAANGTTHLIVRPQDPAWTLLHERPRGGLRLSHRGADGAVFGVVQQPSVAYIEGKTGWYAREYDGARTWRWSSGDATLHVWNPGDTKPHALFSLQLASFRDSREVAVTMNDERVAELRLESSPATYQVGPVSLPPGRSVLRLTALAPVGGRTVERAQHEPRNLVFRLGEWIVRARP